MSGRGFREAIVRYVSTTHVPLWDRVLHELWWRAFRWPEKERALARVAITHYYAVKAKRLSP